MSQLLDTGNVPTPPVYNQSLSISQIDTDTCRYAPRALTQAAIEIFGNQNSAVINQDINIIGSFSDGAHFRQVTDNNIVDAGLIAMINPPVTDKQAANLLYQGYSVMDGSL